MMSNAAKNFIILAISLKILHDYFDDPTKLFLDMYVTKFLAASAKSFFPCILEITKTLCERANACKLVLQT